MESFLVYLFNFYYAISELEQNKQNNTIIIFFTIYFFNKKVDLSSLRGGAGAPIAPPPPYGPDSDLTKTRAMKNEFSATTDGYNLI